MNMGMDTGTVMWALAERVEVRGKQIASKVKRC
jgi:hypothetical protein